MRKLIILTVLAGTLLIGSILLISFISNNQGGKPSANSGQVYSERLSRDDLLILEQPVTMETLAQVVGEISSVQDVGSGRTIYYCESKKYGSLTLELEYNSEVEGNLEIMKCTVSRTEGNYVLFGKYSNPNLNELPKQ